MTELEMLLSGRYLYTTFHKKKEERSSFSIKPLQLGTVKTYPDSIKNKIIKYNFNISRLVVTIQKPMSDLKAIAGKMVEKKTFTTFINN